MTTETRCEARMRAATDSRARDCGNPVKGTLADGTSVCGIHLAVERNRTRKNEEYERQRALQGRLQEGAKEACLDLADVGIHARPEYTRGVRGGEGGWTGNVVVSPSAILKAISTRRDSAQVSEGRDGSGD